MPLVQGATPVTLVFWNITATAAVAGLFVALWMAIGKIRRGTSALDAAVAFAVLVCAEAALLNLLSVFSLVSRSGILVSHVALIAAVSAALVALHARRRLVVWPLPLTQAWWWMLAVLGLLVAASAVRYAPNSGDAMTYHLARVAHWIQNGSVAPYP